LPDIRNNKSYKIIKLEMGATDRCWMQENLTIAGLTLTAADSNVASNFAIPAVTTTAPANSYAPTNPAYNNTAPYNADPYGYLYNWATAIAYSSAHYGGSTSQNVTGNAAYSICPKGWRLPVGGTNAATNEFILTNLNSFGGKANNDSDAGALAGWTNATTGFAAVYAGDFTNGAFLRQGTDTGFWSASSSNSSGYGYNLELSTGNYVGPQYAPPKTSGYSIRCVFGG
jgi:uncharacterized protein (TIGR02145 family)